MQAETEARAQQAARVEGALAFEPGRSLDDAIAEYERERAAVITVTTEVPEGVAAQAIEPISTAIGQPMPASTFGGAASWTEPAAVSTAPEPQGPDVPVQAAPAALPVPPAPVIPGAARACPSCGLSLSASARFCRRCGTQQQVADAPR